VSNDYEQLKSCILKIKKIIESKGADFSKKEPTTKTGLVEPFLECLGYDARDPEQVDHEHTADIGAKRGEKVDYAIKINGTPIILIEAKKLNTKLDNEPTTQLRRYFNATDARIGIVTDGRIYNFYSDAEKPNIMDDEPYFVFDACAATPANIKELARYTKCQIEGTLENSFKETVRLSKYESKVSPWLESKIDNPSDDFINLVHPQIPYKMSLTKRRKKPVREIFKRAFQNIIASKVAEYRDEPKFAPQGKETDPKVSDDEESKVAKTTKTPQEAKDAFEIIKAIAAERNWPSDLYLREFKKDDGCLWDNTQRCRVATLLFRDGDSRVIIFDTPAGSEIELKSMTDLYQHRAKILAAIARFANSA